MERQRGIVGEALNQARTLQPGLRGSIQSLDEWIGLRHRISHAYDRLDHAIVWDTIVDDVPRLLHDLAAVLNDAPPISSSDQ